jgi:hypothetical protein
VKSRRMTLERELALNLVVMRGKELRLGDESVIMAGRSLVCTPRGETRKASIATLVRSVLLAVSSWVLPVCGWFR